MWAVGPCIGVPLVLGRSLVLRPAASALSHQFSSHFLSQLHLLQSGYLCNCSPHTFHLHSSCCMWSNFSCGVKLANVHHQPKKSCLFIIYFWTKNCISRITNISLFFLHSVFLLDLKWKSICYFYCNCVQVQQKWKPEKTLKAACTLTEYTEQLKRKGKRQNHHHSPAELWSELSL